MSRLRLVKKAESIKLVAEANWIVEEQYFNLNNKKFGSNFDLPSEEDENALPFVRKKFIAEKEDILKSMQEECPHLIDIDFELKLDASSYFYGVFSEEPDEEERQKFLESVEWQYSDGIGKQLEYFEYRVRKEGNMEYSYNIVLYPDDFYIELKR
jgi:hypothetical protein